MKLLNHRRQKVLELQSSAMNVGGPVIIYRGSDYVGIDNTKFPVGKFWFYGAQPKYASDDQCITLSVMIALSFKEKWMADE